MSDGLGCEVAAAAWVADAKRREKLSVINTVCYLGTLLSKVSVTPLV